MITLTSGERHLLRLIDQAPKQPDGWATVSGAVKPLVEKLPADLIEMKDGEDGGGFVRLTENGRVVLPYIV